MEGAGFEAVYTERQDAFRGDAQKCLIVLESLQRCNDGMEGIDVAGCLAPPAVDDQILRVLRDIWIKIVEETAEDSFLKPTVCVQVASVRGVEWKGQVKHEM